MESLLRDLVEEGVIRREDRVLTVCAANAERDVLMSLDFEDVVITGLDPSGSETDHQPYPWSRQDAMALAYEDGAFDVALVCDGLHHCSSPHRALLEMYRVAKRAIVVIESCDNALMRIAVRLRLTGAYELAAVQNNAGILGGVDNTSVPNHVYRWTEREFKKVVRSYDPTGRHRFIFRYGYNLPPVDHHPRSVRPLIASLSAIARALGPRVARRQGNSFAMIAVKPQLPDDLWPWLALDDGVARWRGLHRTDSGPRGRLG